ncbi:MAG: SIS domain-containing protein [Verrucomicrobiae bacterium]|nr:SIS domain-containing protein [Verrucomicrobiae bacterium]
MTVTEQWQEAQEVLKRTHTLLPSLEAVCALTIETLKQGKTLFSCGNGGSAADALHFAEEFTGRYRSNRKPLPAISLVADTTALTCIANDFGYTDIFSRPLEALAKPGDLLFAFSTSGNSPNILKAIEIAKKQNVKSILLSGQNGGKARDLCEHPLLVPSSNTARIQEIHGLFIHMILEAVEQAFS